MVKLKYNRIVTSMFQISWNIMVKSNCYKYVSDMPAPCQSSKTAPFRGLGGPYNLCQISPKEAGKTAPQRGMHTPYGLRQLVQGHFVPTTSSSTTGTGTATKSVKAASTSRRTM